MTSSRFRMLSRMSPPRIYWLNTSWLPHHLVVFKFEHVAVQDVAQGGAARSLSSLRKIEPRNYFTR